MKPYLKWWAVLLGALVVLSILVIALGKDDAPKNRKIAEDLLEYHRLLKTNKNLSALPISLKNLPLNIGANLTNLPFRGGVICEYPKNPATVVAGRDYDLFIIQLHQHYWIEHSITNASEWTLYRYWSWNDRRLVKHKLLTIIETNTPPH